MKMSSIVLSISMLLAAGCPRDIETRVAYDLELNGPNFRFVRHHRTGLCFFVNRLGFRDATVTQVPCTDAVLAEVSGNMRNALCTQ